MTRLTLYIELPSEKRAGGLKFLKSLVGPAQAHLNCLDCRVLVHADDENALCLMQEWRCREDLDHYLRGENGDRLLDVIELCEEAPDFRIDTLGASQGLEYFSALRNSGPS